jgi:hypothetical protein
VIADELHSHVGVTLEQTLEGGPGLRSEDDYAARLRNPGAGNQDVAGFILTTHPLSVNWPVGDNFVEST